MSRRLSLLNQTSPKTDFTIFFPKCWATSMTTSWAWREVHLGFVRTSAAGGGCMRRVGKGDEFDKAAPAPPAPLLRQQPGRMVPAPLMSFPRLRQVRVTKLAPVILRPARAPCRARRLQARPPPRMIYKASMSLSKSLCARFEHSRAPNQQF